MSNLRDIIDRNKLFTMIYSGVEYEGYLDVLVNFGVKNFLMSFHYVQDVDMKKKYAGKDLKFFIDSGAHTYQNDAKYLEYSVEQWEAHLVKYLNWAKENKDYISAIVNFDFENLVGGEVVKSWNQKFFEPFMLETGIPVCFVWHQNSAVPWDYYCKRYPYVGFSSVNTEGKNIEFKEYVAKIKVAQKHGSVVHGFGMTRTSLLPKLPFYTVDSTSWKVGLRYGLLSVWTGKKVKQYKKDKWDSKCKPFIDKVPNLDYAKVKAEEMEETVKANIYAYMKAEEYIRTQLRSKMYWLNSVTNKNNIDDESLFPPFEWLTGETNDDYAGWEDYARKLNIGTQDDALAVNAVIDCTIFCNWEKEEYQDFIQEKFMGDIENLHEQYINQIRETDEERIEDLIAFFKNVAQGKDDSLMLLGGNGTPRPKERAEYIEDEEYELQDVSEETIKKSLANILSSGEDPAPDIADLEDEIFKERGIVPVRDENGKFLKGQTRVRKPKNLYSDKFPKLACDTCYAGGTCTEYEAGMVCAFNKMFKRFDSRNMVDVIESMQGMVNLNLERMQRLMVFEVLDGGMIDGNLSALIDQNMRLMNNLKNMYEYSSPEVLRQTKVVRADGTTEESTEIQNPSSGGILEKLFSSPAPAKQENHNDDYIDTEISEK